MSNLIDYAEQIHATVLVQGPRALAPPAAHLLNGLRDLLQERDDLAAKVCDDCDGSGEYLIDDKPRVCICVGETKPYQKLAAALRKIREAVRVGRSDVSIDRIVKKALGEEGV